MAAYFDYAFIGLGASNCLLIKQMDGLGLLHGASIAIIEPDEKNINDRTFCFWATQAELETLLLKNLVSKSWQHIKISNSPAQNIAPMQYHHIAGIDLYNAAKSCLKHFNVSFYKVPCRHKPVVVNGLATITLGNVTLLCKKVFDCRPPLYVTPKKHQTALEQSFYGLKVTAAKPVFDKDAVTLMNFDVAQMQGTQFIYTLPFSETQALIELTRFGVSIINESDAHSIITGHLQQYKTHYTITEVEHAVIPMYTSEIQQQAQNAQWVAMGKQAGMLKPSTGYAFHAMAEHAKNIATGIKTGKSIIISKKSRFLFYDRLLLKILQEQPDKGKYIFETLFLKVPTHKVLNFLKEKTNLAGEIKIFSTLPKILFLNYAIKDAAARLGKIKILLMPLIFTCIFLLGSILNVTQFILPVLLVGFLALGLPHGALDYLEDVETKNAKGLGLFVGGYIFKAILVGVGWYFLPNITLLFFIFFSAWHFGQADFFAFKLKQSITSFIWGSLVLLLLFVTHLPETSTIVATVNANVVNEGLQWLQRLHHFILLAPIFMAILFISVVYKRIQFLLTFFYLTASYFVPVLLAFGTYFIFQHSLHGWQFLKVTYKETSVQLWKKAMPFSMAAILFITWLYLYIDQPDKFVAIFFVFTACISLPHVISMNRLYKY